MSSSTHPDDLLAGHVDGSLTAEERAIVEAHLATCETCREELELARGAVRALDELPDEPVPVGVMNPVTAEIGRQRRRSGRASWHARLQWAAGLAAAAALVGVLVVTLPRLGGETVNRVTGGGGGAAQPALGTPAPAAFGVNVQLEDQSSVDYDAATLEALAGAVAAKALGQAADAETAPRDLIPASTSVAESCLAAGAHPTEDDRLVRLISARFEGTPAYLGVYLESPGADQPASKVIIWVVAQKGCRILSFSSQRL
jgi:hypothetical protein